MAYALRDDNGAWTEIVEDFVVDDVQYPAAWPNLVENADRASIGIATIVEGEPPTGVRILGTELGDVDGKPTRRWLTEPFGSAERRAAVDTRSQQAFLAGYAPTHAAFANERLQVRDNEDRTNWLTSQASYAAAVAAGYGDVVDASFRTAANRTVTVSYADGLAVLLGMATWGRTILARAWALKDAIDAGQPYDLDEGWPE